MKCRHCGDEARPGSTRCEKHWAKHLARSKAARKERMEAGLCTHCARAPEPGKKLCAAHAAYFRDMAKKRKEDGKCARCKGPRGNGSICQLCVEKKKQKILDRVASGKCGATEGCEGVPLQRPLFQGKETLPVCEHHWFHSLARTMRKSGLEASDMRAIWERQGPTCGLTGDPISVGHASLDHIIPESKGGKDEAQNLRYTTLEANYLKRDLLDDELAGLCAKVLARLRPR